MPKAYISLFIPNRSLGFPDVVRQGEILYLFPYRKDCRVFSDLARLRNVLAFRFAQIGRRGQQLITYGLEEMLLFGVDQGVPEQWREIVCHYDEV